MHSCFLSPQTMPKHLFLYVICTPLFARIIHAGTPLVPASYPAGIWSFESSLYVNTAGTDPGSWQGSVQGSARQRCSQDRKWRREESKHGRGWKHHAYYRAHRCVVLSMVRPAMTIGVHFSIFSWVNRIVGRLSFFRFTSSIDAA